MRPRLPPRRTGPLIEKTAFREPSYVLFAAGMFFAFWGCFFAFYYISSFARDRLQADAAFATEQLMVMNALGIPGRLLPALCADRLAGPMNTLIGVTVVSGGLLFAWTGVVSLSGLWAFSAVYGAFASGIMGLFPPTLSSLTDDLQKGGVRMGMAFTVVSFACLTGPPIGGALVQRGDGDYIWAQVFAGTALMVATILLVSARVAKTGLRLKAKI